MSKVCEDGVYLTKTKASVIACVHSAYTCLFISFAQCGSWWCLILKGIPLSRRLKQEETSPFLSFQTQMACRLVSSLRVVNREYPHRSTARNPPHSAQGTPPQETSLQTHGTLAASMYHCCGAGLTLWEPKGRGHFSEWHTQPAQTSAPARELEGL